MTIVGAPSPLKKQNGLKPLERSNVKRKPMTIQQYAINPPSILPKTDNQRLKELKELMIRSGGKDVAQKVIDIALNDNHPGQMAAIKMCLDRSMPVSMFEKDKGARSAVSITITGIGGSTDQPVVIDSVEDVEPKNE